ncbi:MAG: trehalose-phosphatase [Actinomycetota bacterium]
MTADPSNRPDRLEVFAARLERSAVLLDFDGTLSAIVARPEQAAIEPGAREALSALVDLTAAVALVSGRRRKELGRLVDVRGIHIVGLYGRETIETGAERTDEPRIASIVPLIESALEVVEGAWVERKGAGLAVHYRAVNHPDSARATLVAAIEPIAAAAGLEIVHGKRVLDLVPIGSTQKGEAVRELVAAHRAEAVFYAGDDGADVPVFDALDALEATGTFTVKVAVRGPGTPAALLLAADLVVDQPSGLVRLLERVVESSQRGVGGRT